MTNHPEPRAVHTQPRTDAEPHYRRRERADQLATVLRIVHQISRIRELDPLIETLAHETKVSLGYASVRILLIEGDTLVCRAGSTPDSARVISSRLLSGHNPAALACKQGSLIFSDDFGEHASISTYPGSQHLCAAAPLIVGGRAIGVIELTCGGPNRWRSADLEALMALARQSAIVIDITRRNSTEFDQLYAALQARADQLALVDDISRAVSASLDQNAALQAIVTQVPRAVPCQRLSLASYDAERQILTLRALWFTSAKTSIDVGSQIGLNETEASEAIKNGYLHYISDLATSPSPYSRRLLEDEHLGSVVHVPIMSAEACLGVLSLARERANAFSANDLALLNSLAPHIATAFKNASLYAQAQQAYAELAAAQEHTLQTERLRTIGEIASGVAHDFNNLLAIILGHMALMGAPGTQHFERSRRAIIQAAEDGAQTVRRIQEFVRAKPEQHSTRVNLAELAEDAINLTRPRWQSDAMAKGVTISLKRDLQPVPDVLGSSSELREVVTNLILNAVDAMPHGGALALATGLDDGMVWLDVSDTGHGIPPEVRARIFEPFYTTKASRGTGLGLAVSRSIALRHQGELSVDSAAGQGSRFRLSLPALVAPAAPAVPAVPAAEGAPLPMHILVVEDDKGVRETLAQLLRLDDHVVDCAADGRAALQQFRPGSYDIVCSDLGMPGMTGWDVLREVRALDPAVTTVLISGWGAQLDPEDARARHVDFVVPKPIDMDALNAALAGARRRAR